jgi:hypothetical protein
MTAVLVLGPPVPLTERVPVEGHENLPARRRLFPYRIDFLFRAALGMEGHRRIELVEGLALIAMNGCPASSKDTRS